MKGHSPRAAAAARAQASSLARRHSKRTGKRDMADAAHAGRTRRDFGTMPDGRPVHEHTLDNGRGLVVRVINLGGIVTALHCPDRDGYSANVVLGLPTLSDYVERNPNFGILVGRYANRIAEGRFTLDGRVHRLTQNDGSNALHGGTVGFGKRWWAIAAVPSGHGG